MRVAAVVHGSQNGTLEELWRLFCTLQVCGVSLIQADMLSCSLLRLVT